MDTGFHITRESITQVNARYHDAIVTSYDQRLEQNHPAVVEWYQWLFERHVFPFLDGRETPTCIDFGCGTGFLEQFVSGRNMQITGIDVSEKMLQTAAGRYETVNYLKADLYTYEPPVQYDLTMENAVLHHLLDYDVLLDKMADLTKPGGVLFMGNEPNRYAYRYFGILKRLFRRTVNRMRTIDAANRSGDHDCEALSEYHLFYSSGINPYSVRQKLLGRGFRKVALFFSLRELFAAVEEAYPRLKLNRVTPRFIGDHFVLSRNFSLIAYK